MNGSPVIAAEDLRKAFGKVTALDGLSLQTSAGSALGLLGPNGSGKTTTVSIPSTALRPDSGHATVRPGRDGRRAAGMARDRFRGPVRGRGSQPDRTGEPDADRPAVPGRPPRAYARMGR